MKSVAESIRKLCWLIWFVLYSAAHLVSYFKNVYVISVWISCVYSYLLWWKTLDIAKKLDGIMSLKVAEYLCHKVEITAQLSRHVPTQTHVRSSWNILWPKSRIIECPLLDNGSVATNPTPLSGQQLNAFNRQRIYNRSLHGNATIVSKTEPFSKVSPRPSECGIYQRNNERTEIQSEIWLEDLASDSSRVR
jgi:hypothetical protein